MKKAGVAGFVVVDYKQIKIYSALRSDPSLSK